MDIIEFIRDIVKDKNLKLVEALFFGFIFVGLIIKILGSTIATGQVYDVKSSVKNNATSIDIGPATASIWGYFIIMFSLIGLIFVSIKADETDFNQLKAVPIGLYGLIIILMWAISTNMRYYSKINKGMLPPQAKSWGRWSSIVIFIMIVLSGIQFFIKKLKNGENGEKNEKYEKMNSQLGIYLFFIFAVSVIVQSIQETVLKHFTVDG